METPSGGIHLGKEASRTQGVELQAALCGPRDTFHALQRRGNQDHRAQKKIYKGIGKNRESSWGWVGERQFINIVEEMAGF